MLFSFQQNRLDQIPPNANVNEIIKIITQEWEFFQAIHNYMTRKTQNNLHSYALTMDGVEIPKNYLKPTVVASHHEPVVDSRKFECSSSEHIHIFSSDTNEDYAYETIITNDDDMMINSTDMLEETQEYFSSGGNAKQQQHQLNYYADASEEDSSNMLLAMTTQEPAKELIVETMKIETPTTSTNAIQQKLQQQQILHSTTKVDEEIPSTSCLNKKENNNNTNNKCDAAMHKLSEREKYYRHKRKFNCRMEKRFDALLNVFGQIVKAEYPSINVSSLTNNVGDAVNAAVHTLFNSDVDTDTDDDSIEEQAAKDQQLQQQEKHNMANKN